MKRKLILFGLPMLILAGITLSGCKKETTEKEKNDNPVEFYSKKFLTDETFATFFKTTTNNLLKLNKLISPKLKTNMVDTSQAYDYVAENVTAQVMLRAENPEFFDLPLAQQVDVMNAVCDTLALESYRQSHSNTPLVINAEETYSHVLANGPEMITHLLDITWQEFIGCTAAALGSALGEYGGVVGQVWRLFTQGSQYLTWGNIWNIAKTVVRDAVPWYKVISVAVGYAACLWAAG